MNETCNELFFKTYYFNKIQILIPFIWLYVFAKRNIFSN